MMKTISFDGCYSTKFPRSIGARTAFFIYMVKLDLQKPGERPIAG